MAAPPGADAVSGCVLQFLGLAMATIVKRSHGLKGYKQVHDRDEVAAHCPAGREFQTFNTFAFQIVVRTVDPDENRNGACQKCQCENQACNTCHAKDQDSIRALRVQQQPSGICNCAKSAEAGHSPASNSGDKTDRNEILCGHNCSYSKICALMTPDS